MCVSLCIHICNACLCAFVCYFEFVWTRLCRSCVCKGGGGVVYFCVCVCSCARVCVSLCVPNAFVFNVSPISAHSVCISVCAFVCTMCLSDVHACMCVCVCVCVCAHACMCVSLFVCGCMGTCVCMCVCASLLKLPDGIGGAV